MEWIKVKTRKLTAEEQELYPAIISLWDMRIPDVGEQVLLTDGKTIWTEMWVDYHNGAGFEYSDLEDYENLWYMPFPEPPKMEEEQ